MRAQRIVNPYRKISFNNLEFRVASSLFTDSDINLDYFTRGSNLTSNMAKGPSYWTPELMFEIEELIELKDEIKIANDKLIEEYRKLEKITIKYKTKRKKLKVKKQP